MKKEYIGESVHIEVERLSIVLTAEDDDGTVFDVIHLQPHVLAELLAYVEAWKQEEPV